MSQRHLDRLFAPRSVALIGASAREGSVGAVLAQNLTKSGFHGPVWPVNPKHREIGGLKCLKTVSDLPQAPDLAVISTPPDAVPEIVAELGELGTRAAVIISAGFGEGGDTHGQDLKQETQAAAGRHLLRIVGPNCLGVMVPRIGLNATFAHLTPKRGSIAFVAQSGAIVTSVLDWAQARGIGFSHLVSLGDMADVDFGDMLDYLASDGSTTAVLLYVESITQARKFMSAARAAARMKPVIVVKAGRHAEGARAVVSHTGALAGEDAVYDAAFRRSGMLRVYTLEELFNAVQTLALARPTRGDRLAIVTNGGGIGVLATDALMDAGGRLAELSEETIRALDDVLPSTWSKANPVDIIGDASGERYADALSVVRKDRSVDGVLVLNCPTAVANGEAAARALVETVVGGWGPPVLTSWVGEVTAEGARRLFAESRVPTYDTPEQAVRAFMYLVEYRRSQALLMETPPSVPEDFRPDIGQVRDLVDRAMADGRSWLTEPESKQVLSAFGIPVVATRTAATPEEAAAQAAEIGGTVALKIISPDITHKGVVGGVALELAGPQAVLDAARTMLERVRHAEPDAVLEGFSVQTMVRRPGAYELILGVTEDAQFGPVLLVGQGGSAAEVIKDKALGLPPLNMRLAAEMLSRTRVYRLLRGVAGMPAANLDAIALALVRLSHLVVEVPELAELDVNPLLADQFGVLALDARIRLEAGGRSGTSRLAIRPYPKKLEETITLADGRSLFLRPILPEDEPALQEGFSRLTPEEVRLRFFVPMKTLDHVTAARFTQIDYDREMALVLTEPGVPGRTPIHGVVRLIADPDNERAEYAIVVNHDLTGMGLGVLLMRRILDYAASRGVREVYGDVLRENRTMLKLCQVLGFTQAGVPEEPELVRVTLRLSDETPRGLHSAE
jgi:acetyltransferase